MSDPIHAAPARTPDQVDAYDDGYTDGFLDGAASMFSAIKEDPSLLDDPRRALIALRGTEPGNGYMDHIMTVEPAESMTNRFLAVAEA